MCRNESAFKSMHVEDCGKLDQENQNIVLYGRQDLNRCEYMRGGMCAICEKYYCLLSTHRPDDLICGFCRQTEQGKEFIAKRRERTNALRKRDDDEEIPF